MPMPMSKEQLLDRLKADSRERLLNSPYFRFSGMTSRKLTALLKDLNDGNDDLAGRLRPLLLMSTSVEVQSIAANCSEDLSDEEASDRAEFWVVELLHKAELMELHPPEPIEAKPPKPIENKSHYSHVDWLDEAKPIGDIAGTPLVLLGHEQGTDDPIVSRDIDNYPHFACFLYELMTHCQDPITITENVDRSNFTR